MKENTKTNVTIDDAQDNTKNTITMGTVRDYIADRAETKDDWEEARGELLVDVLWEAIDLLEAQSEDLGIPKWGGVDDYWDIIDGNAYDPLNDAIAKWVYADYGRDEVICTSDWDGEDDRGWSESGIPCDVITALAEQCQGSVLYAMCRQIEEWHNEDEYPGSLLLEDLLDEDDEDAIRSAWIRYIGRRVQYSVVRALREEYYEEYVVEVLTDHKPQCLCDLEEMTAEDLKAVDIDNLSKEAVRAVREYIDEDDED